MPRCCRFFVSPRREEDAYPQRSVTDAQRRRSERAAPPGGRGRFGLSGGVASSSQVTSDMLVARAWPSQPKELSRDMSEYFNRLLTRDGLGVADRARESREHGVYRRGPVAIWRPVEFTGSACRLRERTSIDRCV